MKLVTANVTVIAIVVTKMSVVYKPLSNTIQWARLSKDKRTTVGPVKDITQEVLANTVLYLYDNEQKVIVTMDGTLVELSMKIIKSAIT